LDEGKQIAAYSYGSGFGAELLTLRAGKDAQAAAWTEDLHDDFAHRRRLDAEGYREMRGA
ncbi:MAG: hydroxymethylglutaryl-CoA synthase, partial [Myxococcota bacterium]